VLRGTVYVAFFGSTLALIAIGIFAVGLLLQRPKEPNPVQPSTPAGFHPRANPYASKYFLGLELKPRAVLLVEATLPTESWLWLAKEAVAHAVAAQPEKPMRLMFWDGGEVYGLPPVEAPAATQPQTTQPDSEAEAREEEGSGETAEKEAAAEFEALEPETLGAFLQEIQTGPRGGAARAFAHAFAAKPRQLVIVGGEDLAAAPAESLRAQVKSHPDARVDVLTVGKVDLPEKLARLARETGGVAERVPVTRLERWYRRAQRGGAAAAQSRNDTEGD
jgi:hypothetical protein